MGTVKEEIIRDNLLSEEKLKRLLESIGSRIQPVERKLQNWERNPLIFTNLQDAKNCNCKNPGECACQGWKIIQLGDAEWMERCPRHTSWEIREKKMKRIERSLPEKFRKIGFNNFDPEISLQTKIAYETCRRYYTVKAFLKGGSIILSGGYGTGKSHLAAGIVNNALYDKDDYYTAEFMTASSLNNGGFEEIEKRFNRLKEADVVVIDDLATETDNQLIIKHLFELVNYRYEHEKGMVITTNFNKELFMESVGDRIWDRLEERSKWIEITDTGSYRKKVAEKYTNW